MTIPGKREVHVALGRQQDLLPVAVLLVDVGTGRPARRARGALRVRRLAEAAWLCVQLLDQRHRADVVAPGLARVDQPDAHRRKAQSQKKRRERVAVAVGGHQAQPQARDEDAEGELIGVRLQPRPRAPCAAAAEPRGQLRDQRERTETAPAVIARNHEHERQRRDRDRPEDPPREPGLHQREGDQSGEDDGCRQARGFHPPRVNGARLRGPARCRARNCASRSGHDRVAPTISRRG